jgi:hypothetical protein
MTASVGFVCYLTKVSAAIIYLSKANVTNVILNVPVFYLLATM